MKGSNLKLYRYSQDFGRMGSLNGVFLADDNDLKWFMGREVWDSDVLGKHSEVCIQFNESTVTELSVMDQTVQDLLAVIGKNVSGTTPYDYDYIINEMIEEESHNG